MREHDERSDRALADLLRADPAEPLSRSMWPGVAAALAARPRRFDPMLVFGIPVSVAAGLFLGILTGGGAPAGSTSADSEVASVSSPAFAAEEGSTLGELWWDAGSEDEAGAEASS